MSPFNLEQLKRYARLAKPLSVRSAIGAWRYRDSLNDVQVFTFFLGYMRSGHTLVGQLLNAHPNIVISHELGALSLLAKSYSIPQVYYLCLQKDESFENRNRTWTGYKYKVGGQYQGTFKDLRVIGDKHGAATVYDFDNNPKLFIILKN
jgi:hypothetical protein